MRVKEKRENEFRKKKEKKESNTLKIYSSHQIKMTLDFCKKFASSGMLSNQHLPSLLLLVVGVALSFFDGAEAVITPPKNEPGAINDFLNRKFRLKATVGTFYFNISA